MDDQMKTCTKCQRTLDEEEFRFISYVRKDGVRSRSGSCKTCETARAHQWNQENRERRNANQRKYHSSMSDSQRERVRERDRERWKRNKGTERHEHRKEQRREPERLRARSDAAGLTEPYVRGLLSKKSSLSRDKFPAALVEAKRLEILINREINK